MSNDGGTVKILPTETYFALVRRQLSENGRAYVRVTGMSMWPLLRHLRDGVVIVPPEDVRRGDIVLFDRLNGRYALHRVIRMRKTGFTMAGDNQWHVENDLPYGQIVGVVMSVERGGKSISRDGFFLKMYACAVTWLTFPRIYICRVVRRLARPFRRAQNRRKGAGR